ncbi:NAD(P)H-dependent oxidoreductase [Dysosmobacter sp.]|uniref:NAD(P)H-dependent oxidoreductase n=1 Tax=Dysosmobacter sp. TaxID=2591382 RepID=UPI002A98913B|nr:NAD(P)H-dependent oxidoreductase [Dysosmobacter sp.]MDY5613458.1 NAD(P)H-dependent oxidoreductase [Dysosmobacter sp.]
MKLLFVDCCISQRGADSRTRTLADAFLTAFRGKHPDAEAETISQETLLALKPFDAAMLNDRDALASVRAWDAPVFALARQFRAADAIVVAAPFWDLSYPTALRTYIEYISANGLTYHYDEHGCHGDCRASRLVYLTSGGDFEREDSVGVVHWRQLAAMFGIPQFDYVFAGGLNAAPEKAPELLDAACALAAKLAKA